MPSSVCMHCRVVDGRYMVYGQLVDGAIFAVNPVNLRGKTPSLVRRAPSSASNFAGNYEVSRTNHEQQTQQI